MKDLLVFRRESSILILGLFLFPFGLFYTPLSILLVLLFSSFILNSSKVVIFISLWFFVFFVFKNNIKGFDSDYAWYFDHFSYWVNGDLSFPFEVRLGAVYARYTEPVYHLFSYFLAKVSGGDKLVFDLAITTLVYLPVSVSAYLIGLRLGGRKIAALAVLVVLLLSINPAMVTQLIRQNIAASILAFSFYFLISKENLRFLIVAFIATLTHNSAIVVFLIIFLFYRLFERYNGAFNRMLFFVFAAFLGYLAPYFIASNAYDVFAKNDGSISLLVYAYDAFFIFLFFILSYRMVDRNVYILCYAVIAYYVFSIFTYSSPLLSLRLYHYFDYVRWLIILVDLYLVGRYVVKFERMWIVVFVVGLPLLELRYRLGAFDFDGGLMNYLSQCLIFI